MTADSSIFKVVDVTGGRNAAFIQECIFADVRVQHSCQLDVIGLTLDPPKDANIG